MLDLKSLSDAGCFSAPVAAAFQQASLLHPLIEWLSMCAYACATILTEMHRYNTRVSWSRDDGIFMFMQATLNDFMALGWAHWSEARQTLTHLLSQETPRLRDDSDLRSKALLHQASSLAS